MYSSFLGALFSSLCCRRDLGNSLSAIYVFLGSSSVGETSIHAYRSCNLRVYLGQVYEGLIEVFDSLGRVLGRLVTNITNATMREELDVGNGELGEVLAHIVLCELWWQPTHKYA